MSLTPMGRGAGRNKRVACATQAAQHCHSGKNFEINLVTLRRNLRPFTKHLV